MTGARVESRKVKMRRNIIKQPKLCSLPPTDMTFKEKAFHVYLQLAVCHSTLTPSPPHLNPTNHGWPHLNDCTTVVPTMIATDILLVLKELLKILE